MHFSEFLYNNHISYRKLTMLLGKNVGGSWFIKQKVSGVKPITIAEFNEICTVLEKHLGKPVTLDMFKYTPEMVNLS